MKRHLIALAITIITAIPATFVAVILLAILNIYLAGHNISWQDTYLFTFAGEAMDWIDVMLWGFTGVVSLSAGGLYLWISKQKKTT
ncbi:MAG: hypothetical protein N2C13_01805 [Chloroflexota bacterium]